MNQREENIPGRNWTISRLTKINSQNCICGILDRHFSTSLEETLLNRDGHVWRIRVMPAKEVWLMNSKMVVGQKVEMHAYA
ncbi:hypothetical protein TcasGA2_TC014719 [Tribolium castaneum]|uniref:Uncharacterized protein n=1 Tax=Tribolium castaneum TaxID=7070 RepID=D6WP12_TRICA|nr:hypothetical protein TcasGA2_TC014719 [Tribolium castaneum]